jgi:RNA polymerase sigma-70 factor, ECF subfamily
MDDKKTATSDVEERIRDRLDAADWNGATTVALRSYGPQLLGYLRALLGREEDAVEVFARVSENLWRSVPQFRGEASFRTFAYRLAWCAAKVHRRDTSRRREQRLDSELVSQLVAEVRSSTAIGKRRAEDGWERLKASLDANERSLLALRLERKLSWTEIAQVMEEEGTTASEPALRKRFERLRVKLHTLARELGVRG